MNRRPSNPTLLSARRTSRPAIALLALLGTLGAASALAPGNGSTVPTAHAAQPQAAASPAAVPTCHFEARMALDGRASPLDSAMVSLGGGTVKVCYGSPRLRGRTMIGGDAVPFGQLWRFGANEATVLHTTVPLSVGGIDVPAGSVSLYAIPGADHWELFLSASTDHWGLRITQEVREQELGSFRVEPVALDAQVEAMTLRFEEEGTRGAVLAFEWQNVRLAIPVVAAGN